MFPVHPSSLPQGMLVPVGLLWLYYVIQTTMCIHLLLPTSILSWIDLRVPSTIPDNNTSMSKKVVIVSTYVLHKTQKSTGSGIIIGEETYMIQLSSPVAFRIHPRLLHPQKQILDLPIIPQKPLFLP